jgi:RHS repeat-associated protein
MNKRGVSCGNDLVGHQPSGTTTNLVRSYVWGLDLSGTEQGAGGVGGLLFIGNRSSVIGHYAAAYDGNGNVMALVDMAGAGLAAAYEYGPFGETIRETYASPLVRQSLGGGGFRFSTKYQDEETGLLYYGYRYYQPSMGRWMNRDPINELGFILLLNEGTGYDLEPEEHLYRFINNNPTSLVDKDGRAVPVVIVIGGAALTAGEAAAIAAAAGAALCGADIHCRQAVEQAVTAAIGAVSSAVATVCKTRCRFKNEPDPHHYFWRPRIGVPPWKKCWMSHIEVRCFLQGVSNSTFVNLHFGYGPCYKYPHGVPPITH